MTSSLRNSPPGAAARSSLTVSKIVAGAGAAATTAVVGSVFGADGTVVGAAVGSVVSAVAAAAYERSFDQTSKIVVARVRPRPGQDPEATQVMTTEVMAAADVTQVIPAQRPAGDTRSTGSVAPQPPARRMRWPLFAGAAVVIFAVGLLFVTGIEFFTGGPVLSSNKQGGTSVGTLLRPGAQSASPTTESAPASAESSAEPTATSSASPTKRSGAQPSGRSAADGGANPSATAAPRGRGASPTTTPTGLPALPQLGN